jgi:hypothetical protein
VVISAGLRLFKVQVWLLLLLYLPTKVE